MSHKPSLMIPALSAVVAALALLGCQKTDETQATGDKVAQKMEQAKEATQKAADATASKIIMPWIAVSQCTSVCMKPSAGLMVPSSATPIRLPISVPRPPEMATPPTTTAAMVCSSRPVPIRGST